MLFSCLLLLFMNYPNCMILYTYSASGTSAVAIDNKIEQAMVSYSCLGALLFQLCAIMLTDTIVYFTVECISLSVFFSIPIASFPRRGHLSTKTPRHRMCVYLQCVMCTPFICVIWVACACKYNTRWAMRNCVHVRAHVGGFEIGPPSAICGDFFFRVYTIMRSLGHNDN